MAHAPAALGLGIRFGFGSGSTREARGPVRERGMAHAPAVLGARAEAIVMLLRRFESDGD